MSENQKLTINDPLSPETLSLLGKLTNARLQLAEQLLDLEEEKIQIMVRARQLEQEKQRVFEKELTNRDLSPTAPVEVDAKTGMISLVKGASIPSSEAPQPVAHS